MANIDNAFDVDILSVNDSVLIASGSADPSIGVGFEAPVGSLFLQTNGNVYRKINTADVDWALTGVGGTDELVKVSPNDTTAGYLNGKIVAGGSITVVENNNGGNETLTIDTTIPLSDLQTEINNIETASGGLFSSTGIFNSVVGDSFPNVTGSTDLANVLDQIDTVLFNHAADTTVHFTTLDGLSDVTITTPLTNDVLTYNGTTWINQVGGGSSADLSSVTIGTTSSIAIPLTMTNILWDITHVENDTATIEHDNVNTDRILIKESGLYILSFSLSFDADPGEETISAQILVDNTTIVPGSLRVASEDDEINDLSNSFTAELTAGTFLTIQHSASGAGNILHNSSNFSITRAKGTRGNQGTAGLPGSGSTVVIQEEGVTIPNSPHTVLNFIGNDITATDAGGGVTDITVTSTADLASVGVGIVSSFTLPLTMTNVSWDITHLETSPGTIEHNNTNIDRIQIKETGLYNISYSLSFDADPGEETITSQVVVNNTTIIPGSLRVASEDDEINDLSNSFTAILNVNDFISLQAMASGTGNIFHNSSNLFVTRAKGAKGDPGIAGAGATIIVQENDVTVTGSPHDTVNFNGADVVDDGGGKVSVTNIFGSEFQTSQSLGVTTTTSTTFQNKVTLTTGVLPAGTYRIGVNYGWNHDSAGSDFEAMVTENAIPLGEIHKQEPKDSAGGFSTTGTSQRHLATRVFYQTVTTGVKTYALDFRTDTGGDESSVFDATIELWRVA